MGYLKQFGALVRPAIYSSTVIGQKYFSFGTSKFSSGKLFKVTIGQFKIERTFQMMTIACEVTYNYLQWE